MDRFAFHGQAFRRLVVLVAVASVMTAMILLSGNAWGSARAASPEQVPPGTPSPPASPSMPAPGLAQAQVPVPTATARPDGNFRPDQASLEVDGIIRDAVATYNLPRWFYYAIIQRESSFDPMANNFNIDYGLTQLGTLAYAGMPYPENLPVPDDNHPQYGWDMNFGELGMWIRMSNVTSLTDVYDPKQNLDRFSTGYAVPAFHLFKRLYGLDDATTLRIVAFHWNQGLFVPYDPTYDEYLGLYDQYVNFFKFQVERQDGVWNGEPALPGASFPVSQSVSTTP
jgi:hypothetical protein